MSTFGKDSRTITELKCVDVVAARNETKLRPILVTKYRQFWFLITDHSAILYYVDKRKASFIFPQGLSSADLVQGNDGSFTLYGIMEDEVVSFSITSWVKSLRQKEKRLKKKMKEAEYADQSSSKRRKKDEPEASNDAIFQNLLPSSQIPAESGERIDAQKSLESRFQMDVIYLDEKDILFKGDNLVDCLLLDNILVTLSHQLGGYIISVSVCFGKGKSGSKMSELDSSSQMLFSHLLTREFLPVSAETQEPVKVLIRGMFETNRKCKTKVNLCATKLVSSSRGGMASTNSEPICHEIFTHMFGTDSSFLESEAVIVGTLDGKILSCVLRGSSIHPCGSDHMNSSQVYSTIYDLEEPVVLVTSMNFISEGVMGTDLPGNNSLLFVGRRGKICLMLFEEPSQTDAKMKTRFMERSIKGPVFSPVILNGNSLFYSTGTELASVKLELGERHDGTSKQRDLQVTSSEYRVRDVACIARLHMELSTEDDTQFETFMTCSTNGKVKSVTIGNSDQLHTTISMTSSQAGQRMKELMLSIHDTTKKINSYQQMTKLQNSVLSELTKAGHLARLLLGTNKNPEPFFVEVRFVLHDSGSEKVQIVECKMTNRTKWTFGHEWSVCASICGKGYNGPGQQMELGLDHKSCFLSKPANFETYKLDNWKPDMFTFFHFTVNDGSQQIRAPYEIKVYLHFRSLFMDQLPDCLEGNDDATGFMLPVCSKRIDILHMLRPVSVSTNHSWTNMGTHQNTRPTSTQSGTVAMDTKLRQDKDRLSDTLKKISEEKMMMKPESEANKKGQDILRISALLMNESTLSNLDLQGLTFIQWLFKDNHLISSSLDSESSGGSIQALSPTDTSVQIIQSWDDEDVSKTKMQVYTTSCQLLSDVWEAVHFRLANSLEGTDIMSQTLMKSREEQAKLIRTVQIIENRLGELRDQLPSKLEEKQGVLCGIYEEMRKLSLRL